MDNVISLAGRRAALPNPSFDLPPQHVAEVKTLPYSVTRRIHSRKPRRSKNGTPEERAQDKERTSAPQPERIDRRKLRVSPLRERVPRISFAVTIVGKIHTATLRGDTLPDDMAGWLEELRAGAESARYVAEELEKAAADVEQHQAEFGDCELLTITNLGQSVLDQIVDGDL